ncbi:PA3371 family protein [Pseudomonas turukhanskensis]|nr:PA3371 family protein [Pseudomonas turukhanskensis]
MSKAAMVLLVLAFVCCAVVLYAPLTDLVVISLLKVTTGVLLAMFALALVLGRRIKFDPVLR